MSPSPTRHHELRIHGVSGTAPRDTLYTDPVAVTSSVRGTSVYEPRRDDPRFETRAFRWGNLTSGSRVTALWLLLAPFAIANAAGWMTGWRKDPTHPATTPTDPGAWHTTTGRAAVRCAGMALTLLLTAQALTAIIFLPSLWNRGDQSIEIFFLTISPPGWDEHSVVVGLTVISVFFLYGLAWLSTRTHFEEMKAKTKPRSLLLGGPAPMVETHEDYGSGTIFPADTATRGDPGGTMISDPGMWTVHPMLHRLRRIHFGLSVGVVAIYLAVASDVLTLGAALALVGSAIALLGLLTTFAPRAWVTWALTTVVPHLGLAGVITMIVVVGLSTRHVELDQIHPLVFGISLLLGVFSLISLFAGPLSVGALVLATFIGSTLGASASVFLDRLFATNTLISSGIGWVAGAMFVFAGFLLLVVAWGATRGSAEETMGATSPLPRICPPPGNGLLYALWQKVPLIRSKHPAERSASQQYLLMVGRRIELQGRHIFHASAVFGLVAFGYAMYRVVDYTISSPQVSGPLGGITSMALGPAEGWLVAAGMSVVLLPIGYFAFRSIRTGWSSDQKGAGRRRQVGILWDLGSFWPRWYHPLAPPGYGPSAIKDLDETLRRQPVPVVLGAHSQGSLIAAVTLAQSADHDDVHLVTYGSQIGILYPRMFPNVGIPELAEEVVSRAGRWVNLWRETDPIGGHYVDLPGVENQRASPEQGQGHSNHEVTLDYCRLRADLAGIPSLPECRRVYG